MAVISQHFPALGFCTVVEWRSPCSLRGTGFLPRPVLLAVKRSQHAARKMPVFATKEDEYVVSFGEALFDCLADQKGLPQEEVASWTPYPGGAPANVACALSKLGVRTMFVGALGMDDLGRQMMELLLACGVDLRGLQLNGKPTRDVLVTRSEDGDREFSGFGKAATTEYADCFVEADKLPKDAIQGASLLVTGTLGLAYPATAAALHSAVQLVKDGGGQVVVDVNWRPVFWGDQASAREQVLSFVQQADLVKCTDTEAEWMFGLPADEALSQPEKVLAKLPNAQGVLVSAGEKGSSYAFHSSVGKQDLAGIVPVLDVDVVDTTGAGDAYLAGFLTQLLVAGGLSGLTADPQRLQQAVQFATACGAFTTTGPGAIAAQPSLEQVNKLMAAAPRQQLKEA